MIHKETTTLYSQTVNSILCRFFSQGDWNPYSQTYGCFDRNYWHYRMVSGFPSAIFQQAALSLALLFTINDPSNNYYQKTSIIKQAESAIKFWTKIQHNDGSFDEWYQFERSHVATAFTSYAISESLILLDEYISKEIREQATKSLQKAAFWLSKHYDLKVANHNTGALAALYNIYLITNDVKWKKTLKSYISILERQQNSEGWFQEYGGADPGYNGLSLDFLAKCYHRTGDKDLLPLIEKALKFNVYFLHPDGSYGGEYGSRNTKYLLPHGLELLANKFIEAHYLLQPFQDSSHFQNLVNPKSVDDRYLIFFFAPNYLYAWKDANSNHSTNNSFNSFDKVFFQAGLIVKKSNRQYCVVSLKKGGVIKVFHQKEKVKQEVYADTGYIIECYNGELFTTQWLDTTNKISSANFQPTIKISRRFGLEKTGPKRSYLLFFHVFMITIGRVAFISKILETSIKRKYIINNKFSKSFNFSRTIQLSEDKFEIDDEITWKSVPKRFGLLKNVSFLHVPSSKMSGNFQSENSLIHLSKSDLLNSIGILIKIKSKTDGEMSINWNLKYN